jgi:membrane protein
MRSGKPAALAVIVESAVGEKLEAQGSDNRPRLASPVPECNPARMEQKLRALWRRVEAELFEQRETTLRRPLALAMSLLRYPYALARDLVGGDLNLRAMSLVYTTLLSIVPLIAFSFSVLKGLGFHRDLEPVIYEFFRPLGERAAEFTDRVLAFVENIQGGVLGSIGLVFLVWTVVSVIQKVEESLNHIWHVERVRSLARRFSEYLSLMVVGPILMVTAFGLIASLTAHRTVQWLMAHEPFGTMLVMAGQAGPWFIVSLWLAFLYSFVPNTRVRAGAALVAGALAGAAWVAAGFAFAQLVAYSTRLTAVYAGFAILLLALMWLWLNWLILLLGAQLAFYAQNPHYLRTGQREVQPTARLQERLALSVMYLVGRSFEVGDRRWTVNELSTELGVPSGALGPVVDTLERCGLLTSTEDEAVVPGRDPDRLTLDAILDAVRDGRAGRAAMLRRARTVPAADAAGDVVDEAIRERLGRVTLKQFVQPRDEQPVAVPRLDPATPPAAPDPPTA